MLSEFDLIKKYFSVKPLTHPQLALGIGDDCALINPQPGMQLAISSDMLVSGRHFFPDVDPRSLGHKSLAVNLSDLAAMGASPLGFTLAIALPEVNEAWLAPFSEGLLALARQFNCPLIGGDTTKGPLNICITILGELPSGLALKRTAAQVGDDIWISGALGDARLALAALKNEARLDAEAFAKAAARLHTPTPRIALGLALRGLAHAALDISDGLTGDLGHILAASAVGAEIDVDSLPIGAVLASQKNALQRQFALTGGDDYELCFTASSTRRSQVLTAAQTANTPVTRIGRIVAPTGLRILDKNKKELSLALQSFDHFRTD